MRKYFILCLSTLVFLFFSFVITKANNTILVTQERNYLLTNVNQEIDTSHVQVRGPFGMVQLNQATLSSNHSEVSINNTSLKVNSKGVFTLEFNYLDYHFPIYLISKYEQETEYTLYEENFDGLTQLPDGYKIVNGNAKVLNGALELNGITSATQVLLPEYLNGFSNYIIESDFTITSAKDTSRWASIMFRYLPTNYYQMAIRQDATLSNGVEFAKSISNQWSTPCRTSYTEAINAAEWYRLKIDVNGTTIKEYINASELIKYEQATEYELGSIGFQASGSQAVYDNIKITLPVNYVDQNENKYNYVPTIYEPTSNLLSAPSVIIPINSVNDLQLIQKQIRPATVIFKVNKNLEIVNQNQDVLMSAIEALDSINGYVIPAFYVEDEETASIVSVFLRDKKVKDVFMISKNPQAILKARTFNTLVRGIIQFDYDEQKPSLSKEDLIQIRNVTNQSKAMIALLPSEYTTQENVFYLQKRLVNVWGDATDGDDYKVILSGVSGLISNDFDNAFNILNQFPENSMIRRPLIIAHRGLPKLAPENTIEGAQLAFENGADIVELDIQMTLDNEVVIFHDSTTSRMTNQNLTISSSTLSQLKALTIKDTTGNYPNLKIPTLKEYFNAFKDQEDAMFFVEIKGTNTNLVSSLKTIANEYEMLDNIVVISFVDSQIKKMNEVFPEISNGYLLYGGLITDDINTSVSSVLTKTAPIDTTVNPSYVGLSKEFIQAINHRGLTVWPWTIDGGESLKNYFFMAPGGITTNDGNYFKYSFLDFEMDQSNYYYNADQQQTVTLQGKIKTPANETYEAIPLIQIVDDGGTQIEFNRYGQIVSASKSGTAKVVVSTESTLPDGTSIVIYGDLVTIEVEKQPVIIDQPNPSETPEPTIEPTSNLNWVYYICGGILVISALTVFLIKRKK